MQSLLWLSMWNNIAQAENPFRVEVLPTYGIVAQDSSIQVTFVVPKGHHLYVDMLSVKAEPSKELNIDKPKFPMGKLKPDPANPEQMREIYLTSTTVTLPIKPTTEGTHLAKIEVRYQGCKEGLCYMPKTETLETPVTVTQHW